MKYLEGVYLGRHIFYRCILDGIFQRHLPLRGMKKLNHVRGVGRRRLQVS